MFGGGLLANPLPNGPAGGNCPAESRREGLAADAEDMARRGRAGSSGVGPDSAASVSPSARSTMAVARSVRFIASWMAAISASTAPSAQAPILAGLGDILIDPIHARLRDAQHAMRRVVVGDDERDLFGRAQAGEEPQLIVMGIRCAPILVESGDEDLRVLDAEGINAWAILFTAPRAPQCRSVIVLLRIVEIAELKGPAQGADRVVVGLFVDRIGVRDLHQH